MSQITSFFNGGGSGTVASVTGGNGINITGNPSLNPVVNITAPVSIANGGTNAITMVNSNGIVYFDGTRLVTTTVGTSGQVLVSNGAGMAPTFQTFAPGGVVSVSGANGINITGPGATPTVNLDIPVTIAHGGTNAIAMTNTFGVNYFDGTRIVTTTVGTAGQILTSNGAGVAPTFQAAPSGGASTFHTDAGDATVSAGAITIDGAHGINTSGTGSTVTVAINNAITLGDLSSIIGSPALTATTGDVTLAAGNVNLPNSNVAQTQGIITLGGTRYFSNYGGGATNVFAGYNAGNPNCTGGANVGVGGLTLAANISGTSNIAIGEGALVANVSSSQNVAIGTVALQVLGSGTGNNVAIGYGVAPGLLTGRDNVFIGNDCAGSYTTSESSNILIGSNVDGDTAESNTIRIGDTGSGVAEQNRCFIAGITGVTTSNSQTVTIDTVTGQLGAATISGAIIWSVINANQTASVNHGYICNKAGLLTITLPTTSAIGDIIEVTGMNTDVGWRLAQNANQIVHFGAVDTSTGTGGYLESTLKYDSIRIVCNVANLEWIVIPGTQGNITVV